MQKFKIADGGNPDGTAKDLILGVQSGTKYKSAVWNDNLFNIFNVVETSGYSLIDDNLEQMTKAVRGKYNSNFTYNTSTIATQTVNDIVLGSDGIYYEAQSDGINNDDPVGSNTGNWKVADNVNNVIVDTISDLRALTVPPKKVFVTGYHSPGDGAFGSNIFEWDPVSTETDNDGTIIKLTSITTGRYKLKYNNNISIKWFGVVGNNGDELSSLQKAIDYSTSLNTFLNIDIDDDIFVSNTVFIYSNTKILSITDAGIVRTTTDVDVDGTIAVLSMGNTASFKTDVEIRGDLRIQLSASLNANTRASNTSAFFVGNLKNSHVEVDCRYAENAFRCKSCFDITGTIKTEWCHKGIVTEPSAANSAGNTCTSLDLRVTTDFTIFPFVLESTVYSRFTGYAEAIRQSYAHYSADEMSVIFTTDGCSNINFDNIGVEAFEGMLVYNKNNPSYIKYKLLVDLTDTDHFEHDNTRIDNITYAEQGLISLQTAGTFDFDTTSISGSSVTVATNNSYIFRRLNDDSVVNINGGFIESGSNYLYSNNTNYVFSNGSRFFNAERYTNTETRIQLGNGLVWIHLGELAIDVNGEFIVAPTGIKQLLTVEAMVIRGVHNSQNLVNIKSKDSAVQWTMITGLGVGFSADTRVLAIEN